MKKLILFLAFFCLYASAIAQVPNNISYQTVVRDANNKLVSNKTIGIEISILQSDENGSAVFVETHRVTTNSNGLASLVIGNGQRVVGTIAEIDWANGPYFVKSATDLNGGQNYNIVGVSELLSVPYAIKAKSAENVFSGNYNDLENKPVNVSEFFNDAGYISIFERGPGNGVPAQVWSLFGNSNTDPTTDKLGTTDFTDLVFVTDNLERLRIQANGDINIDKSLEIGEDLTVARNVFLNTEYGVNGGETINNGDLTVANASATSLTGTLDVDGATNLNSTLDVNNGAATNLTGTLDVDEATNLNSTLDVNNNAATNLTGTLNVDGASSLNSTLDVDGATSINDDLDVTGNTDLGGTLDVAGTTTLNGAVDINSSLDVTSGSSYVANFVNTTDGNGISIQVEDNVPDSGNNFISFRDSGGSSVGRIEGQTLGELQSSFNYIWWHEQEALNTAFQIAMVAVDVIGVDDFDAAVVEGIEMVDIISNWAVVTVDWENNVGISYSSGSGDYAEWLEKYTANEVFSSGDIVGVKGGKISKNLPNPDKFMVVSTSPIVLGNMPDAGQEGNFEKIAFMGQVPVKVRGAVHIGDYILASNLMDGFGIAVNPNNISIDEYERIVGVAWSGSENVNGVSMVNVAVGINTNDAVREIKKQQNELTEIKKQLNSVISYLKSKDTSFDASIFEISEGQNNNVTTEVPVDSNAILDRKQVLNRLISMFNEQPEVLEKIMADARKMLDDKGINYNQFDQTRRLVTEPNYFIEVIREFNN